MESTSRYFDTTPIALDALGPERIEHFYDPRTGLRAVVVVDHLRFGMAGGGVRMAPDLDVREMARLARAMSFKYALLEMPTGGAKAGIWCHPGAPERPRIMASFLEAIRALSERGEFMPGPDMGTTLADFEPLYGGESPLGAMAHQEFEGMPLEEQLTGYGVVVAAKRARRELGCSLEGARVAIEGFGKVGAGAAKFFAREGARVVALSTVEGALYDPEGLDVVRLLELRAAHGDGAIKRYRESALLVSEALITLPTDVLVPGARPDSLRVDNAQNVLAGLVVPAANIPYADGSLEALAKRGVVCVPDFVANAGGVIAVLAAMEGRDVRGTFDAVRERIDANVARIFDAGRSAGITPYEAAVQIAEATLLVAD